MPYKTAAAAAARMRAYRVAHPDYRARETARKRVSPPRKRKRAPITPAERARLAALPKKSGEPSKFSHIAFVGIDGEGMTVGGEHRYVLLASSDGSELLDEGGIGTAAALDFLADVAARAGRRAALVCYGASYDVNMMLGSLDRATVASLWEGQEVQYGRYRLRYRPRKALEVRRVAVPEWRRVWSAVRGARWEHNIERSFTLWDVIGFFQSTFLGAMDEWLTVDERHALGIERIERGKARRSAFALEELDEIRAYTRAELRVLGALMRRLKAHLVEAGLVISRWDGAGAVAAAILRREGVKAHIGPVTGEIEQLAQHAYYGGRIEAVRYGTSAEAVWQYDLRSAYPAAMTQLPSLAGGIWHAHEPCSESVNGFAMVRLRWLLAAGHEIFPFAHRDLWGEISYPAAGEGWCWWPEYEAARAALHARRYVFGSTIEITDARCFHPVDPSLRPFAFVPELYELRARWKREGKGAEKVLKLGLNSLYGKMAQQVGYRVEEGARETKRPPYHSLGWAGYVTALTRSRVYALAMERPDDVIMFATDALFSSRELRSASIGTGLGQWEVQRHAGIIVAQSGVYWTMTPSGPAEHSRGFDSGALDPQAIRAAWEKGRKSLLAPATRFVTMGAALDSGDDPICQAKACPLGKRRHKVWRHWRTWRTTDRELSLEPEGKREHRPRIHAIHPERELVPTRARAEPTTVMPHLEVGCPLGCVGSFPYPLLWRGQELAEPPSEDQTPLHLLLADIEASEV